jgi:cystathionine beta-synthase
MSSIIDLIGETPLVELTRFDRGPCRLFLKLESLNPSGSLKDRPARVMIEAAEADGRLKPGGTVVEATAGNTGLGLALVGGRKGYRTLLVVPDKMAREKILHAQAMGAEVTITRSDVGKGHPDYYQDLAEAITRRTPGAFFVNQFANPANPGAHESTTGPEILRQMEGAIDAVVVGVGSGGMLTGIGRFLQRASPNTAMILADPDGSILAPFIETGRMTEAGTWAVEGIGEDFIPANADLSLVSKAYSVKDEESFATSRELLRCEGILAGSSSGTLLAAALRYCREQTMPKRVVTLACDSGAKYLSKVFNPTFLAQEGWTHPDRHGMVGDVVINRYSEGTAIVVRPDDNLRTVFMRMRSTGVSQLPVVDPGGKVVGLVDESDVLAALITEPGGANRSFARQVKDVMVTRLETIAAEAPVADLVPLFRRDYVGIVMEGDQFVGLATRLDLINYFRITPA